MGACLPRARISFTPPQLGSSTRRFAVHSRDRRRDLSGLSVCCAGPSVMRAALIGAWLLEVQASASESWNGVSSCEMPLEASWFRHVFVSVFGGAEGVLYGMVWYGMVCLGLLVLLSFHPIGPP